VHVGAAELEKLRREKPGSFQICLARNNQERQRIHQTAKELGLCLKVKRKNQIIVYVPADELVYGVVPFSFEELGLHEDLVLALLQWKPEPLETATHIQAQSIPKLLKGYDLVIQSETGSGKTLAYMLPAAHQAILRSEAKVALTAPKKDEAAEGEAETETEMLKATCFKVEAPVGPGGLTPLRRPDRLAPRTRKTLHVGDEFMVKSVRGSHFETQYLELADGSGWVLWEREDVRLRFALSVMDLSVGQRVSARRRVIFGSGDIVEPGTLGTIERVLPLVGVRWDGLSGVKAVQKPRSTVRRVKDRTAASKWARCAPDTLIITATRELCEQTADVARKLGRLLPEAAQEEWTVAVAVGAPPGVGKRLKRGKEQWPFPSGPGAPKVLVTTLEFMGYFFHKKHLPLWSNVRCVVYDEVDRLVAGPERWFLNRVKTMFLRCQRTEGTRVQSVLVAATMPSQGTRSTRLKIGAWMPAALRALPRPELLHRQHPMVLQEWRHVPTDLDEKAAMLAEHLKKQLPTSKRGWDHKVKVTEKTLVFCNTIQNAALLAEALATKHGFRNIGLHVRKIGNDERRLRLQKFRDGEIMLLVTTDVLSRGIDIPDLEHVVQFDFARNVVDHIHRIGRISRCGTLGNALNFYDDSEQGGRKLAEAIQNVGDAPLDGLFSRNRGFAKGLRRTEAFKQMLLMQGLPLPPHFRAPGDEDAGSADGIEQRPMPLLAEMLDGVDDDGVDDDDVDDDGEEENLEEDLVDEDEGDAFEKKTDEDKDSEYLKNIEALHARQDEDGEDEQADPADAEGGGSPPRLRSGGRDGSRTDAPPMANAKK